MTVLNIQASLEHAVGELPGGLRDHVFRVVEEAGRLAPIYGIDEERALVAALGHDLARAMTPAELLQEEVEAGRKPSEVERAEPILLHGPLSARLMAERHRVEDADALSAARFHTTARAGMSDLERLIFVADKIEPGKRRGDAMLEQAANVAGRSLTDAMRVLLDRQVTRAVERGWPLHPNTVAARNELLL